MYVCMYVYVGIYLCVMYVCQYVYIFVCVHVLMFIHVHVRIIWYVCFMYICMYVYVYVHFFGGGANSGQKTCADYGRNVCKAKFLRLFVAFLREI